MYPDRYGGDKGLNEKQKAEYWIHVGRFPFLADTLSRRRSTVSISNHDPSLDHCIDNIRQTVMCYSDVSTIPWKWHERVQGEFPDAHTTHICRDFDALTEWMMHPDRHFPQEKYQLRVEAFHASSHASSHANGH